MGKLMEIKLDIHEDGSLWRDDVKLAEAHQFTEAEISEAAKRMADAIDAELADRLFREFDGRQT